MKKNIIKSVFVVLLVLASGVNFYKSQKENVMSDVVLANVDALASDDEIIIKKEEVYYPQQGDANYGTVKCVCWGDGDIVCC